jgi:adenosine kinase
MKVLISGSLAYDRILNFEGKFSDSILPDKIHDLNVSFFVPDMRESFGGCGGNIAYSLALLEEEPVILARGGNDFHDYDAWLKQNGIATDSIEIDSGVKTAVATILTDSGNNQISSFYAGANGKPYSRPIPEDAQFAIIGPGHPEDIKNLPEVFRSKKIQFMFDPGQSLPVLSADDLKNGMKGAYVVFSNDYELSLIKEKTGLDEPAILREAAILVTTFGGKGSRIMTRSETVEVPAAKPENTSDPTGAGDAYRAGFIAGLLRELPLKMTAQLAGLVAAYTVETHGTQTHRFTIPELKVRYQKDFNETLRF